MVLVDAGVHFTHVQVIKCDIKTESVEKSKILKMGQFFFFLFFLKWKMGQFQQNPRSNSLRPYF
jgi:hypothetical protein